MNSKKRAFLTGGGGYVGMNLAAELERHDYSVFLADVKFPDITVCNNHCVLAEKIEVSQSIDNIIYGQSYLELTPV